MGPPNQVVVRRPSDTVHTPRGDEHCHSALPDHSITQPAVSEVDDVIWGDHDTDNDYDQATREAIVSRGANQAGAGVGTILAILGGE